MIKLITFEEILNIWSSKLWPNRSSKIEPTSAMSFMSGYDMRNMDYQPDFLGYSVGSTIVGVNSGHMCADNSFRSRGLYVDKQFRGLGIGIQLLKETMHIAKNSNAKFIWSLPRQSSWKTYKSVDFILASPWHATETSDSNAYCYKIL